MELQNLSDAELKRELESLESVSCYPLCPHPEEEFLEEEELKKIDRYTADIMSLTEQKDDLSNEEFDKKVREVLIEFERIFIPDDESVPETDTQMSTESGNNKLTSPQPTTIKSTPTTTHEKQDEIDDFDFLGDEDNVNVMMYINSANKDPGILDLSCMPLPQEGAVGSKNEEGDQGSVRRNPVRKAKEGISYTLCDDDDIVDYCKFRWRLQRFGFEKSFPVNSITPFPLFRLLEV
eukprot:sb/3469254/